MITIEQRVQNNEKQTCVRTKWLLWTFVISRQKYSVNSTQKNHLFKYKRAILSISSFSGRLHNGIVLFGRSGIRPLNAERGTNRFHIPFVAIGTCGTSTRLLHMTRFRCPAQRNGRFYRPFLAFVRSRYCFLGRNARGERPNRTLVEGERDKINCPVGYF